LRLACAVQPGRGRACVVRETRHAPALAFYMPDDAGRVSIGMATSDDGLRDWKQRLLTANIASIVEGIADSSAAEPVPRVHGREVATVLPGKTAAAWSGAARGWRLRHAAPVKRLLSEVAA
jgi:hypothetical protein